MSTVLVVDDNASAADALAAVLAREGHAAEAVYGGREACARLDRGGVEVVLTDLRMDDVDGFGVLAHARRLERPPEVLVLTGYGGVGEAVEAMRLGARDFLTKPVAPADLLEKLSALGGREVAVDLGDSPAAVKLREELAAVAGVPSTVLVVGEPGSGRRRAVRSVAPGALRVVTTPSTAGDLAGVDSLFVPDVDRFGEGEQAALGRLLDGLEGVRVLASASPGWRGSELYYRLAVLVVRVPALRERLEDLPALVEAIVAEREEALGRSARRPAAGELARLARHRWPGNLRELEAVVERAVVFGSWELGWELDIEPAAADPKAPLSEGFSLQEHLEAVERELLVRALEQAGGERSEAGRLLGLERNTLRYKLKKYGLL